jgi:hypothetical protein
MLAQVIENFKVYLKCILKFIYIYVHAMKAQGWRRGIAHFL